MKYRVITPELREKISRIGRETGVVHGHATNYWNDYFNGAQEYKGWKYRENQRETWYSWNGSQLGIARTESDLKRAIDIMEGEG